MKHLRCALQHADLRAQVWQRADHLLLRIEPRGGPGHDRAILGFDKRGDLLKKDDERGLKALEARLAIALPGGELVERRSDSTVERLLALEKRREPAIDDADPRTVHAGRKGRRRRVERRTAARQPSSMNERAIERGQGVVVAAVGLQLLAILVAHGDKFYILH